jgi:hypothetical protein
MRIISDLHWVVPLHKLDLGGNKLPIKSTSVLFDTGSTFTFMPEHDFNLFLDEIKKIEPKCAFKKEHFVCPPSPLGANDPKYPQFKIYGGVPGMGAILEFSAKQYFWNYGKNGLYLSVKPKTESVELMQKIDEVDGGHSDFEWLMGNRFLQSYHQVYDYKYRRVGMAIKRFDKNKKGQLISEPEQDQNVLDIPTKSLLSKLHKFKQDLQDLVVDSNLGGPRKLA